MSTTEPKVGMLADHVSGKLDPREVAKVETLGSGVWVWLYLLTDEPAGPFPAENYHYYKKAGSK